MQQTVTTLLLLLFVTSSLQAGYGVKFKSQPNRKPPLTKKIPIKAQFRLQFSDLDGDGTPDIAWRDSIYVKVISGQSKGILWQYPLSSLPGGGSVPPDVLGFVRSPSLDGPAVVMSWTDHNNSDPGVMVINSGDNQVVFADGSAYLLAVADPDRDSFMDLIIYQPGDEVILVVGETGGNATTKANSSSFSTFSSQVANSDFQLSLKFESEPDRELAYDLDQLNPPGALDIDGDGAMDIVMITEDANGDPAGILVRDGGGSYDIKWQFDFPDEHKDNIVTAFHGFFDPLGSGTKQAIVGANLAITADGTVHVIDDNLEILAVFDVDGDGLPELIGRGLADSTVQVWGAGAPTGVSEDDLAIAGFQLLQNYPNPFNPSTTIRYSVENAGEVELRIYNMLGQTVRTLVQANKPAGDYSAVWDGQDDFGRHMTSGQYFYRFKAGELQSTRTMILLK